MNWFVRCVRGNLKNNDCQTPNLVERHHGKKKKKKNNLENEDQKQRSNCKEEEESLRLSSTKSSSDYEKREDLQGENKISQHDRFIKINSSETRPLCEREGEEKYQVKNSRNFEIDSESISTKFQGRNRFGFCDPLTLRMTNTAAETLSKKEGKSNISSNQILFDSTSTEQVIENKNYSRVSRPSMVLRGTFDRSGKSGVKVQDGENGIIFT